MFEVVEPGPGSAEGAAGVLDARTLSARVARLASLDREVGDAERVDQIRMLEEIKAAAAAAQAGHRYQSTAPPLPGTPQRNPVRRTLVEYYFTDLLLTA
ncbi:MAG: hypothetical protein ACRDPJ_11315 [Nocardioidaceae bacterium]